MHENDIHYNLTLTKYSKSKRSCNNIAIYIILAQLNVNIVSRNVTSRKCVDEGENVNYKRDRERRSTIDVVD